MFLQSNKQGRSSQVDEAVLCFDTEINAKGTPLTRQVTQLKTGEIAKALTINERNFKTIRGWYNKFRHNTGLLLKCGISVCQKLPVHWKLLNF